MYNDRIMSFEYTVSHRAELIKSERNSRAWAPPRVRIGAALSLQMRMHMRAACFSNSPVYDARCTAWKKPLYRRMDSICR